MSPKPIYLASPLGFSEPGAHYLEEVLHPALRAEGFAVLDPWAAGRELIETHRPTTDEASLNSLVGAKNRALIEAASAVLAVLDGVDVDSGTASEIGFAAGIGRAVVGLRSDLRLAGENAAAPVNLQVLYFLESSGGGFTTSLEDAFERLAAVVGGDRGASLLYHLTTRERFERALGTGSFDESTLDQSLDEVGFIHCSYRDQLAGTAARFYAHLKPSTLVALVIDPDRLGAPVRVEEAGSGERFPHVYGPIELDAVVALRNVECLGGDYRLGSAFGPRA